MGGELFFARKPLEDEGAALAARRGPIVGFDSPKRPPWNAAMASAQGNEEPSRLESADALLSRLARAPRVERESLKTGIWRWDESLQGGLPTGVLCEAICPGPSCGGQTALLRLIDAAARAGRFAALIDGQDRFDPQTAPPALLERLLWIRCAGPRPALKAADELLRDENLGMVLLDLRDCDRRDLQRVPSSDWYRLQRLVGRSGAACVIFTPSHLIPSSQARFEFGGSLGLALADESAERIAQAAAFEVIHLRRRDDFGFPKLVGMGGAG